MKNTSMSYREKEQRFEQVEDDAASSREQPKLRQGKIRLGTRAINLFMK